MRTLPCFVPLVVLLAREGCDKERRSLSYITVTQERKEIIILSTLELKYIVLTHSQRVLSYMEKVL